MQAREVEPPPTPTAPVVHLDVLALVALHKPNCSL